MIKLSFGNTVRPRFDETTLYSSVTNTHIPAISARNRPHSLSGNDCLYYKPESTSTRPTLSYTSVNLLHALNERGGLTRFDATKDRNSTIPLYVGNGYITDLQGNPLLVVSLLKSSIENLPSVLNASEVIVYISSDLLLNKDYSTFYRRLQLIYLHNVYTKGIEVRIVNPEQMLKNTFTNEFRLQFNSVTELDQHLKTNVRGLLRRSSAHFKQFDTGLNIPPFSRVYRESYSSTANVRGFAFRDSTMVPPPPPTEYEIRQAYIQARRERNDIVFVDDIESDVVFVEDEETEAIDLVMNELPPSVPLISSEQIESLLEDLSHARSWVDSVVGIPEDRGGETPF